MIGVSTTLIGLVKVVEGRIGPSHVDEYAGIATLPFLVAAIMSSLSSRLERRAGVSVTLEHVADGFFVLGVVMVSCIALFFAYALI